MASGPRRQQHSGLSAPSGRAAGQHLSGRAGTRAGVRCHLVYLPSIRRGQRDCPRWTVGDDGSQASGRPAGGPQRALVGERARACAWPRLHGDYQEVLLNLRSSSTSDSTSQPSAQSKLPRPLPAARKSNIKHCRATRGTVPSQRTPLAAPLSRRPGVVQRPADPPARECEAPFVVLKKSARSLLRTHWSKHHVRRFRSPKRP